MPFALCLSFPFPHNVPSSFPMHSVLVPKFPVCITIAVSKKVKGSACANSNPGFFYLFLLPPYSLTCALLIPYTLQKSDPETVNKTKEDPELIGKSERAERI